MFLGFRYETPGFEIPDCSIDSYWVPVSDGVEFNSEFLTNVKVPLAALASRGCVMLGETSFQKPDLEERLQAVKCIQGLEVANLHLS